MNKMLVSLFILAISIAFVSVIPAAQAWEEQGNLIGAQTYGEHEIISNPEAAGASASMMGQFEAGGEVTGNLSPIYYGEKYPDFIPL